MAPRGQGTSGWVFAGLIFDPRDVARITNVMIADVGSSSKVWRLRFRSPLTPTAVAPCTYQGARLHGECGMIALYAMLLSLRRASAVEFSGGKFSSMDLATFIFHVPTCGSATCPTRLDPDNVATTY